MSDIPIILTAAGRQPTPPAVLRAQIVALAEQMAPGLTANLPGALIEDVASTETAAVVLCDQAVTETINSLTPLGANQFLLLQLGAIYGTVQGAQSNPSVYVVFTDVNSIGFVVNAGFIVADSAHQYVVQDGGEIGAGGSTQPLFCLATISGTWAIPANTVTTVATGQPAGVNMTCTNPTSGLPGGAAQSEASYRSQVLQDGLAVSQGMTTMLKAQLARIPGVLPNLISIRFKPTIGYEVIVGGGDSYDVANAIFEGVGDLTDLIGSTIEVTDVTAANPGVVTTDLNHGHVAGDTIELSGIAPGSYNGPWVIPGSPAVTNKTFPIGDTSSFQPYVSGGVLTPNFRNLTQAINDFPDTYDVVFVNPPQQLVTIDLLYQSTSPNLVSNAAIAAAAAPALMEYVNGVTVGKPMILYRLQEVFSAAVATLIPPDLLTVMNFSVTIAGVSTPPEMDSGIIAGDPESYFYTTLAMINIMPQG